MKKKYIIPTIFFIINLYIVEGMQIEGLRPQTVLENAIGLFLFLAPIEVIFFFLSREEKINPKIRTIIKILFWFFPICFLLGIIANLIKILV